MGIGDCDLVGTCFNDLVTHPTLTHSEHRSLGALMCFQGASAIFDWILLSAECWNASSRLSIVTAEGVSRVDALKAHVIQGSCIYLLLFE